MTTGAFNPSTWVEGIHLNICKFEASLVFMVSSRTTRAVSKTKIKSKQMCVMQLNEVFQAGYAVDRGQVSFWLGSRRVCYIDWMVMNLE